MIGKLFTTIFLTLFLISASCGPKTRIITLLSESDRSKIKKVAIQININPELDARISTIKDRYWTSALDGISGSCEYGSCLLLIPIVLAWMVTEEAVRSNMDQERENEFNEDLSDINMEQIMAERLDEYFENTGATFEAEISKIQSAPILAQQGFDTILDISVDKLEVLLCPKRIVYGYIEGRQGGVGPLSSDDSNYIA